MSNQEFYDKEEIKNKRERNNEIKRQKRNRIKQDNSQIKNFRRRKQQDHEESCYSDYNDFNYD